MKNIMQTTQTGLTRILARFGRNNDRKDDRQNPQHGNDWRKGHWYDCDVSSRGL